MNKYIFFTKDIINFFKFKKIPSVWATGDCQAVNCTKLIDFVKQNFKCKITICCNFLLTKTQYIVIIVTKHKKGRHFV